MSDNPLSAWMEYARFDDPILLLMLASSVVIVALALERFLNVLRARRILRKIDDRIVESARKGNLEEARRLCESIPSPWREVWIGGFDRALGRVAGDPRAAMVRENKRAVASLKAAVWMLGTAGALMPFMGLLGTVLGVMSSFAAIGSSGQGGFAVVSAGISAALIATAAGLFVALEAVVFFNILQNSIGATAREAGLLVDETVELLEVRAHASRAG